MGLKYRTYLNGAGIFCCKKCKTHLSSTDAIISRVGSSYCVELDKTCLLLTTLYDSATLSNFKGNMAKRT
jgi:hypothetical protein